MLEELKREKVKLAVLSNKPHAQAVKVVKEIFGEGVFDYVSGQQEGIEKKPTGSCRSRTHHGDAAGGQKQLSLCGGILK